MGEGGLYGIDPRGILVPTLAELGVVLLLLLLGLEYSGTQLVETARQQSRSGLIDLVLNATPGVAMALILGWGYAGALALGGVTYISSSGIVSQVVRDLRWRRNPETRPVVSILILEDLVMAPYLPILTVVLTGAGLVSGLVSTGIALVVVAVVILIAVRQAKMDQTTLWGILNRWVYSSLCSAPRLQPRDLQDWSHSHPLWPHSSSGYYSPARWPKLPDADWIRYVNYSQPSSSLTLVCPLTLPTYPP